MSHPGEVMNLEVQRFMVLSLAIKERIGIFPDMEFGAACEKIRVFLNNRFPQIDLRPSDPISKAIPWLEQANLDVPPPNDVIKSKWKENIKAWEKLIEQAGHQVNQFFARCVDGDFPTKSPVVLVDRGVYEIIIQKENPSVCFLDSKPYPSARFIPWVPEIGEEYYANIGGSYTSCKAETFKAQYDLRRIPMKFFTQERSMPIEQIEKPKPEPRPDRDDPELEELIRNINEGKPKPVRPTPMEEIAKEEDARVFAAMEKEVEAKKDKRWKYTGDGICSSCKRQMYLDAEKKVCLSCFMKRKDLVKEVARALDLQKLKCIEKRIAENPKGGCLLDDVKYYHILTGGVL